MRTFRDREIHADLKVWILSVFTSIEQILRRKKDKIESWREDSRRIEMQGNIKRLATQYREVVKRELIFSWKRQRICDCLSWGLPIFWDQI